MAAEKHNIEGEIPSAYPSLFPMEGIEKDSGIVGLLQAAANIYLDVVAERDSLRAKIAKLEADADKHKNSVTVERRDISPTLGRHEPGFVTGRREIRKRIEGLKTRLAEDSDDMKECVYLQIEATIVLMTGLMGIMSDPHLNQYFTSVADNDRCNLDPITAFLNSKDLASNHVNVIFDVMKELHLLGKETEKGTVARSSSGKWSIKVSNPQMKTFRKWFLAAEGWQNPDCFYPVGSGIADPTVKCELPNSFEEWQLSLAANVDDIIDKHAKSGLVEGDGPWQIFKNLAELRGIDRTIGGTDLANVLSGTSNPHMKAVVNIAKVLGVTMSQLLRRYDG